MSWPRFLGLVVVVLLGINAVFASLYALEPGSVAHARPGRWTDDFFFSVETLATVGYGEFYPQTPYAHVVATLEIISGVVATAILTGLIFFRFSRPKPSFLYAEAAVISHHRGKPALMLRVAHRRTRPLYDAAARLDAVLPPVEQTGQNFRSVETLPLRRRRLPVFAMSWTLIHEIDETSPVAFLLEAAPPDQFRVFLALEARDPVLGTTVHDIRAFGPRDIRRGVRFADMVSQHPDGRFVLDLARLSTTEPEPEPT